MKKSKSPIQTTIVVGLGRSGIAAAKYLNAHGEKIVVLEQSKKSSLKDLSADLEEIGIKAKTGIPLILSSFNPWIKELKKVIIGPGIDWNNPVLNQLREQGIQVQGEISIAWQGLKTIPWVGITGTNGKTTVTHMLSHVLKQSQINAKTCGNVGKAASEVALELKHLPNQSPSWLIVELSSYQIESAPEISPEIGIWTTLTPDHLERHGSIENYFQIKKRLLENSAFRIYNADDEYLLAHRLELPKGYWVSTKNHNYSQHSIDLWISSKGAVIEKGKQLFKPSVFHLRGEHNLQNLLLVIAAARKIGISPKNIKAAITSFKGIEHRLEKVCDLEGIEVLNDSKATNFDSAQIGIQATLAPAILIAGGQAKHGETYKWTEEIKRKVCAVILFGENRDDLENIIRKSNFEGFIYSFSNLDKSVEKTLILAKKLKAKSILFSPGCASFDLYNNFEERGTHFKNLIKKLNHIKN